MQLRNLTLTQFKNYTQQLFNFESDLVCITGPNGCGKTTILDAIHFLCFTKSYFFHSDQLSIKNGTQGFRIEGEFRQDEEKFLVECILRENQKEVIVNGENYKKFSAHIGRFPCIMISPDDIELINEGSEIRRKFIDIICSMINSEYVGHLNNYNKNLQQRNSLIKQYQGQIPNDLALINIYNQQLDHYGQLIFEKRKLIIALLAESTGKIYQKLSGEKETITIIYQSTLHQENLLTTLPKNLHKDIASMRTNYGIHKDDLLFEMNSMPFKQVASQGQKKSFVFGLKLAMFKLLEELNHSKSILLLDDIFEKLDAQRMTALTSYLIDLNTQIFITDTHIDRLTESFVNTPDKQIIQLSRV